MGVVNDEFRAMHQGYSAHERERWEMELEKPVVGFHWSIKF